MVAGTFVDAWRERAVYVLLFLFPIGAIGVRHWISGIFGILALLSLPDLLRRPQNLSNPERRLMIIVAVFIAISVVTAVANGWTEVQTRYVGREVRFLVLVPIYLMVRRYPRAGWWLLRGGVVGGFAILAQALYDTHVLGLARAQGIYSPNLLGPFAALIAVLMLVLWRIDRRRTWLRLAIALAVMAALSAVAFSVSRGAFVGLLGMLLVWGGFYFRGRYYVAALVGIVVLASVAYTVSDHVRRGIDTAVEEVAIVVEGGPLNNAQGSLGSVAARIEMWRVSLMIFRDHPLLGVGRGNYTDAARPYVSAGRVHQEVIHHGHPHDAYLEMLVSKGIFGLIAFLALLFYPLAVFVHTRRRARNTALLGAVLITGFALFSLTDASTFIKGNFISIFVIYLAVVFAWHMQRLRGQGV